MSDNPFLSGMLDARAIRQSMLQEAQFRQRLLHEQRIIERQKRLDEMEDFKNRLALATDPALQELAPGQTSRDVSVEVPDWNPAEPETMGRKRIQTGLPIGEDYIDAPAALGGKRYAVRGREELFQDKIREGGALAELEALKQGEIARRRFEASAFPAPEDTPGFAPGTPLPHSAASAVIRAMTPAKTPVPLPPDVEAQKIRLKTPVPLPAEVEEQRKRLQRTPGQAGGEGGVSWANLQERKRQNRVNELRDLEAREQKLSDEVATLRILATEAEEAAQKNLAASRLRNKEAQLRRLREEKVRRGFTSAEDAGLKPTKSTTKRGTPTAADPLGIL